MLGKSTISIFLGESIVNNEHKAILLLLLFLSNPDGT